MNSTPDSNLAGAGGEAALAPLYACVLIGGQSTRMGTPKHLLPVTEELPVDEKAHGMLFPQSCGGSGVAGQKAYGTHSAGSSDPNQGKLTWVERTVDLLSPLAVRVVLSGAGEVPPSLAGLDRIPDAPNVRGPMAGVLACMRSAPQAAWLVAACDLIRLDRPALQWLVGCRRAEVWAVLPRSPRGAGLRGSSCVEPTLACYEPPARPLIAQLAAAGQYRLAALVGHFRTACPTVPTALEHAWHNTNTPDDLLLP